MSSPKDSRANLKDAPGEDGDPPKSAGVSILLSPKTFKDWIVNLSDTYGSRLLIMLVVAQVVLKGFVAGYAGGAFEWLLQPLQVSGPKMQVYKAITHLPWALKPFFGMMSDAFPIFGYHKNPYLFLASLLGISGLVILGISVEMGFMVRILVMGLFFVILQVSLTDLLTEAKYAERMRAFPRHGPDLITFVWCGVTIGGLIATGSIGPVIEYMGPHWCYLICIPFAALILVPTVLNYLDEERKTPEEQEASRAKYFEQWELTVLVFIMTGSVVSIVITSLVQDSIWVTLAVALTCVAISAIAFNLLVQPMIGKMNTFATVQTTLAFSIYGSLFYFYTDGPKQYPEGPHFSPIFLMSVIGLVGGLVSLAGFTLYNLCFKHWKYHALYAATNLLHSAIMCLGAVQYSRLNVRLGIPDEAFAIGYATISSITASLMWLPQIVLLTQMCPKNVEATMYALLAGCHNLGGQTGEILGACILDALGVTPTGAKNEGHKFDNLWIAALISACLPLVTLLLLPWLIPNRYQTERLLHESSSAVEGSYLRRCGIIGNGTPVNSRRSEGYSTSP